MEEKHSAGRKPGGVFVTQGMTLGIPPGGLRIDFESKNSADNQLTLHVGLDVTRYWLQIAVDHTTRCMSTAAALNEIWASGDDAAAVPLLEEEFSAGIQALCAAAFAVDAFYATVKERITLPPDISSSWKKNRTSRPAQIYQVLQRGFYINASVGESLQKTLKDVFDFRDKAVHPPASLTAPVWHPQLNINMEWRFVVFRAENAINATKFALTLISYLLHKPRKENGKLTSYCQNARTRIEPVVTLWESQHGALFDRSALGNP